MALIDSWCWAIFYHAPLLKNFSCWCFDTLVGFLVTVIGPGLPTQVTDVLGAGRYETIFSCWSNCLPLTNIYQQNKNLPNQFYTLRCQQKYYLVFCKNLVGSLHQTAVVIKSVAQRALSGQKRGVAGLFNSCQQAIFLVTKKQGKKSLFSGRLRCLI
jgi:hypothetical protein